MEERRPPVAPNLTEVAVRYATGTGEGRSRTSEREPPAAHDAEGGEAMGEDERQRAQLQRLTTALEDIVTIALSSADYKERAIMMHRRAVAALSEVRGPRR